MLSTLKTEQIYRFNPRTHVGCDIKKRAASNCSPCFNPRTHVGCDLISVILYNVCNMFQSTHPRRVRRYYIHYLHPGTQGFNPRTHVGCDRSVATCSTRHDGFNPRTHVGCDSSMYRDIFRPDLFQSTHPRRVRPIKLFGFINGILVSIHAPT